MKINKYQKILLAIYAGLFFYFSIIHVPFKINYTNEIEYDTLFSNKSNLDVPRLVLIILIISILIGSVFLLLRNANFKLNFKLSQQVRKSFLFVAISILIIVIFFLSINKYFSNKKANVFNKISDSTMTSDTNKLHILPPGYKEIMALDLSKLEVCTPTHALKNFNSYMKFYYPDWKIYGDMVVKEQSDCVYRIQFKTQDPDLKYINDKEVMIAEISYNYDYTRYTVTMIRGYLH